MFGRRTHRFFGVLHSGEVVQLHDVRSFILPAIIAKVDEPIITNMLLGFAHRAGLHLRTGLDGFSEARQSVVVGVVLLDLGPQVRIFQLDSVTGDGIMEYVVEASSNVKRQGQDLLTLL